MARDPLTARRLFGLDRSVTPRATQKGQPLHPLTLPNAIGVTRLTLIPIFLLLALESGDGRAGGAALIYAVIGASDYLDGLAARITGQYSRLGALLDPLVDRLLVLSGVIVTWHFDLLPRWALGVLAAREVLTLILSEVALRTGRDIEINMIGRAAVWPTMFSIFLAMLVDTWVATALLLSGVALSLIATGYYIRDLRRERGSPSTSD
jgi:cardiolipin synthase